MNAARNAVIVFAALATAVSAGAADWSHWRGPERTGESSETGLIDGWSVDGENLLWRVDFVGRSTPVVIDGRVCANGRAGEDELRQERVACFDGVSGEMLWEQRFNVYNTSVPWTRVGWGNLAADPETGYLYMQGVGGIFVCLDSRDGRIVWSRNFIEHYGFMEGYGGRTQTPLIDEDRVVITFSNTSWGDQSKPLHRLRAFDKRTGELIWVSTPADSQADKNTQSTPNILIVDGRRMVVAGNGGGGIYAVDARTGVPVWGFQLSKRGINTSVLVDGTRVFASHSEENMEDNTMGRVVAIDGTGSGDVTKTHEIWRRDISAGYASPAFHDGRLYVIDNSANLHAIDADTGEELWELNIGRVGKGSPVVADGKVYATEVNGRFVIAEAGVDEGKLLDVEEIEIAAEERTAEIYSSPAIANGRIYFTTEEGLYSLGDPEAAAPAAAAATASIDGMRPRVLSNEPAVGIMIVPPETVILNDETASFTVRAYDAGGRYTTAVPEIEWSLSGLEGSITGDGVVSPDADAKSQTGQVVAKGGGFTHSANLRVIQRLPAPPAAFEEDFEGIEPGSKPDYMFAYRSRFEVEDQEGNKVLTKGPAPVNIHRHITFLGHPDFSDYTIEGDLMGTRDGRRLPDLGLINSGYTLEILGGHGQLQIRTWQAELRIAKEIDFEFEPDLWYRMKLRVEEEGGKALVNGKVWPRDQPEPADWSITVEDPLPIRHGSPGLSGYSPTPIHFDNIKVTRNR